MNAIRWAIPGFGLLVVAAGAVVYRPTEKISLDIANGLIRREHGLTVFGDRRTVIEQTWVSRRLATLQHPVAPADWRLITVSQGGLLRPARCGYGEAGPVYPVLTDLGYLDSEGVLSPRAADLLAIEVVERWRMARDPEACWELMTAVCLAAGGTSPLTAEDMQNILAAGSDTHGQP